MFDGPLRANERRWEGAPSAEAEMWGRIGTPPPGKAAGASTGRRSGCRSGDPEVEEEALVDVAGAAVHLDDDVVLLARHR